jgi:hypothetical protein
MLDSSMNRDEPPGLYVHRKPIESADTKQLVGHLVQSTAVHSRREGWLPCVHLTLELVSLVGVGNAESVNIIMQRADVQGLIDALNHCIDAADWDALIGPKEGQ